MQYEKSALATWPKCYAGLLKKNFFTMLTRAFAFAFVILGIASFGYAQHSDTLAEPPVVQDQDTVTRLQIYLDEHSFGPGKIDGRWGDFCRKGIATFPSR
jgi:hypothetical protein